MPFTRRTLLKLIPLTLLIQWPWRGAFAATGFKTTLAVFLDTLMPADETPAASELGIDQALLERAAADDRYERLIRNGCGLLDRVSQRAYARDFSELDEAQRIRIVEFFERQGPRTLARAFFRSVRDDLFELYYSQPQSWPGLGMDRPPQPAGYMDYQRPPGHG
ncbi:hypothetical protein J2T55_002052 [Methylohalomonas lacus]|uniref:Gluconate 2-dehydrogenase subunit 3 family protein n=1 Tax=Methylohalomonas lacus TaxID=398773 RepID=A0AAE3HKH5_9GAMM|nr:gluconate 2-dehydrogenase subunit 3 family protein [Methylohalomonas lacus]MCS3904020.1 hypothetical protein [Methylohalomonas lacus]